MKDFLLQVLEEKGWGSDEHLGKLNDNELKSLIQASIIDRKPFLANIDSMTSGSESGDILEGKRVLIVDDKKINLIVTRTLLNKLNVVSEEVSSGEKAIEYIKEKEFDAVLMDIQMPEMNGFEALDTIKKMGGNIPAVIAFSGASLQAGKDEFLQKGFDEYLKKPVSLETLEDTLKKVAL